MSLLPMADIPTHVRYALQYASAAETLRETSPASAGEIMWLAVVQAAQATGHRQNIASHTQTRRGIRNIVGRLPIGNRERVCFLNITNATVTNRHGLAYRPPTLTNEYTGPTLASPEGWQSLCYATPEKAPIPHQTEARHHGTDPRTA